MTRRSGYEPRDFRLGINHPVVLVRADGAEATVTVTNLSQRGFRLRASDVPRAGEHVIFRGSLGDVPAQVRWAVRNEAGGIFLQPEHH